MKKRDYHRNALTEEYAGSTTRGNKQERRDKNFINTKQSDNPKSNDNANNLNKEKNTKKQTYANIIIRSALALALTLAVWSPLQSQAAGPVPDCTVKDKYVDAKTPESG